VDRGITLQNLSARLAFAEEWLRVATTELEAARSEFVVVEREMRARAEAQADA